MDPALCGEGDRRRVIRRFRIDEKGCMPRFNTHCGPLYINTISDDHSLMRWEMNARSLSDVVNFLYNKSASWYVVVGSWNIDHVGQQSHTIILIESARWSATANRGSAVHAPSLVLNCNRTYPLFLLCSTPPDPLSDTSGAPRMALEVASSMTIHCQVRFMTMGSIRGVQHLVRPRRLFPMHRLRYLVQW